MPSIGPTTAFYKVDASLTHTHKEVGDSRQRIAFGKQSANAGDRASSNSMIDAFRLDFARTHLVVSHRSVPPTALSSDFPLDPTPQTRSRTYELFARRDRWRKRNGTSLMV